jgi:predicted SAM-dependent methyltransferase
MERNGGELEQRTLSRLRGLALEWLQRRYRPALMKLYRPPLGPPLSLFYRGDRVECPCCGGTFRKFMPTIKPVGPNRARARCPSCGARERTRLLWLYLENKTNVLTEDLRVLHFAPERMVEKRLKSQPNVEYVSADIDPRRALVEADITDLPFADNSFDVILCSHVLEHVVDDRAAMRELYRVLTPRGWAIVLVPIASRRTETFEDPAIVAPEERERIFGQADHVRIYGRDFRHRLEQAGFVVTVADYRGELGEPLARRYGLRARKPILHVCVKDERVAAGPGSPSPAAAIAS